MRGAGRPGLVFVALLAGASPGAGASRFGVMSRPARIEVFADYRGLRGPPHSLAGLLWMVSEARLARPAAGGSLPSGLSSLHAIRGSLRTLRWRKADSNRWSQLRSTRRMPVSATKKNGRARGRPAHRLRKHDQAQRALLAVVRCQFIRTKLKLERGFYSD